MVIRIKQRNWFVYKENLINFRDELEKLLNKKVNIVIEKYANPIVLYRARKEIIYVGKH